MLAAMPGPDCPDPAARDLVPSRPLATRKEVTAMCPCCGTSAPATVHAATAYANAAELNPAPPPRGARAGTGTRATRDHAKWPQAARLTCKPQGEYPIFQ